MTKFGSEKTITDLDENESRGSVTNIYRDGQVVKTFKQFKIRTKVANTQQEMSEFIRWSDDVREKRKSGLLAVDKGDETFLPSFAVQYPRDNEDGAYFTIRTWTEVVLPN